MNRTRRSLIPLALAALLAAAPPAAAQPDPGRISPNAQRNALDISFPGGTMRKFVEAMQSGASDYVINVLLRNQAADLDVPPMNLRSVSIKAAFELAIPRRGQWSETRYDGSTVEYFRDFEVVGGDAGSAPVFVVDETERVRPAEPSTGRPRPEPRIEVFSVEHAVSGEADVQRLLAAIDSALALGPADGKAELKFHPDSALLIARGAPDQISTIDRVIERFRESGQSRLNQRAEQAHLAAQLEAEVIERQADVIRAEARMSLLAEELTELKALAGKQMASDKDIRETEAALRVAEAELQAAASRLRATQEKAHTLSASAQSPKTERRVYSLTASGWKSDRVRQILHAADGISEHITGVEASGESGAVLSTTIEADEDGHLFVKLLLETLDASGPGTKP